MQREHSRLGSCWLLITTKTVKEVVFSHSAHRNCSCSWSSSNELSQPPEPPPAELHPPPLLTSPPAWLTSSCSDIPVDVLARALLVPFPTFLYLFLSHRIPPTTSPHPPPCSPVEPGRLACRASGLCKTE